MKRIYTIGLLLLFVVSSVQLLGQRKMERMDRGIVAIPKSSSQIYISWRHFATDPDDIAYNVYYKTSEAGNSIKLNSVPIANSTNYLATLNTASAAYTFEVKSVVDGVENDEPGSFTLPVNTIASRIVHDFDFQSLPAGHPTMGMKFCWPADLDGDGKYDYVLDRQNYGAVSEDGEGGTADYPSPKVEAYSSNGTFLWRIDMGPNVKICNGHNDMVTAYDMDGDGKAEVLMAVSEGTTFADGTVITGANGQVTNYRTLPGSAPQWLSIVNGATGVELHRVALPYFNDLVTTRTDDWKEMGGHFIIAYLDGIQPSLIYQYKNRAANGNFQGAYAAWRFNEGTLQLVWSTRNGGADFHQVRVADVDGDGRDEFVEGGFVMNHDGSILNHHKDAVHGDRHMLGDIDPDRPGLEHFVIQQNNPKTLGMALYDAKTGEMIKGIYQSAVGDVGRGVCAAFDPTRRGLQFWSTMQGYAMFDSKGNQIPNAIGNFPSEAVWWGPDFSRYELNGVNSSGSNVAFHKFNTSSLRMDRDLPNLYNESNGNGAYYFSAANGARAAFWGDILGDWREEMVFVRSNSTGFVVLSTWEQTNHRIYHLMQNPAYRGQTTARGYYQTPDVDFYMAADMPKPPVAPVQLADLYYTPSGWVDGNDVPSTYSDASSIMYDLRGGGSTVSLASAMAPSKVFLMTPIGSDYTFSGTGKFTGDMDLVKSMQGTVVFNGAHEFTGITRISEGRLVLLGEHVSAVQLDARGVIAGSATLKGGITLEKGLNREGARIEPGALDEPGTMTIIGNLSLVGRNNLAFKCDQTKTQTAGKLIVEGDFTVAGTGNCIIIQPLTTIQEGRLTLVTYSGNYQCYARKLYRGWPRRYSVYT
jgi:fibronectin-binding autotransporter adhesin